MKRLMIAMIGLAAVAGCATRQTVVTEGRYNGVPGITHLSVRHVHLKSVLGIEDVVLADTNRFILGDARYSQEFKLEKPFGGFADVRVYLDEMDELSRRKMNGKPHRLRSVELKRHLPNAVTEDDLVAEWQASCDFIADILEVESPKVRLVDIEKLRKSPVEMREVGSCLTFDLADGQDIDVRLTEPTYAIRGGKAVVVSPGYVKIDLDFNRNLYPSFVKKTGVEEKVEKELDFGPDCSDKLAKALKDSIEGQTKRAKRKQVKENIEKKGDEKNVDSPTNTVSAATK